MSSQEFTLSPCTPEDVEGMTQVYLSAFATNAIAIQTFASVSPSEMDSWLLARFHSSLHKPGMRSIKIVHNASGTTAAFLRYQFPHVLSEDEKVEREKEKRFREEEKKQGRDPNWPVGANLAIFDDKFGQLGVNMERFVDAAEMYVAQLLATSPDFQRKGLASMLLGHVLDQADKEGRKMYIEATPSGHPVYYKLGFRDVAVVEVDLNKYGGSTMGTNVCMIREPQEPRLI